EGLFKWYRETSDFDYCTYLKYYETERGNAPSAVKITPAEYLRKRTALFADKTRIDPSAAVAELLSCLCEKLGGGIFDCGDSVAAGYPDGDTAVLYEIAAPTVEAFPLAAASVAAVLGCAKAKYRVPSETGQKFISSYHPLPDDCFFGYSFD
ncbi:MAG: hypothetical protein HUJ65_05625, partial [Oscillospiraceae bacterium]|nr:hypothetical protein [Oscillospiraceae bacterium]